jgi:hypothetical protein
LWDWITDGLGWYGFDYCEYARIREVDAALQLAGSGAGAPEPPGEVVERLAQLCKADHAALLDIVETMLQLYGRDRQRGDLLRELLKWGDCAYAVKAGWDGLELRVASGDS